MHHLLQNEKDLLAKRKAEGRNDLTARIVISRIEQEIKRLERRIEKNERKATYKCPGSGRLKNVLARFIGSNWTVCYEYYCSVFRVLTGTESRKKEGAK